MCNDDCSSRSDDCPSKDLSRMSKTAIEQTSCDDFKTEDSILTAQPENNELFFDLIREKGFVFSKDRFR